MSAPKWSHRAFDLAVHTADVASDLARAVLPYFAFGLLLTWQAPTLFPLLTADERAGLVGSLFWLAVIVAVAEWGGLYRRARGAA